VHLAGNEIQDAAAYDRLRRQQRTPFQECAPVLIASLLILCKPLQFLLRNLSSLFQPSFAITQPPSCIKQLQPSLPDQVSISINDG